MMSVSVVRMVSSVELVGEEGLMRIGKVLLGVMEGDVEPIGT